MNYLKWILILIMSSTLLDGREIPNALLFMETSGDTLQIANTGILKAYPDQGPQLSWPKQRLVGLGAMALFGALSCYFHHQADEYYQQYLRAGSYRQIDRLFEKSQRYDRYAGWSYFGMEISFVFTVFTFDKESP